MELGDAGDSGRFTLARSRRWRTRLGGDRRLRGDRRIRRSARRRRGDDRRRCRRRSGRARRRRFPAWRGMEPAAIDEAQCWRVRGVDVVTVPSGSSAAWLPNEGSSLLREVGSRSTSNPGTRTPSSPGTPTSTANVSTTYTRPASARTARQRRTRRWRPPCGSTNTGTSPAIAFTGSPRLAPVLRRGPDERSVAIGEGPSRSAGRSSHVAP